MANVKAVRSEGIRSVVNVGRERYAKRHTDKRTTEAESVTIEDQRSQDGKDWLAVNGSKVSDIFMPNANIASSSRRLTPGGGLATVLFWAVRI